MSSIYSYNISNENKSLCYFVLLLELFNEAGIYVHTTLLLLLLLFYFYSHEYGGIVMRKKIVIHHCVQDIPFKVFLDNYFPKISYIARFKKYWKEKYEEFYELKKFEAVRNRK